MIYCAHCGAQNPAEARFCYRCGKPILLSPETPVVAPPPFFAQAAPQPNYVYSMAPPPGYAPVNPELARFHPLTEGIKWFPADLPAQPRGFYSYVNPDNRLVFARRAGFWKRFLAAGLDFLVLLLPIFVISSLNYSWQSNGNTGAFSISSDAPSNLDTANPLLSFLFLGIILAYFFIFGLANGQSVGKKTLHLRVMRLDGRKPDWMTAAVRYLAGYLLSVNLVLVSLLVLIVGGLGGSNLLSGLIGLLAFG